MVSWPSLAVVGRCPHGKLLAIAMPCALVLLTYWRGKSNDGYPLAVSPQFFHAALNNTAWLQRWQTTGYFEKVAGEERILAETYPIPEKIAGEDDVPRMCLENHTSVNITLSELLRYLGSPENLAHPMYLADSPIPHGLLQDVPASIPSIAGLRKSGREPNVISLFLGNGSASEYHYDMRYSALVVQVSGSKRFVVAPPSATPSIGLAAWYCRFGSLYSCSAPSHPGDGALAATDSQVFDLKPGDALYIPKFYWHAAYGYRQKENVPSLTVSYFYPEWLRFSNFQAHPSQLQCARDSYGADTLWLSEWL